MEIRKKIAWSAEKSEWLLRVRGFSFVQIAEEIGNHPITLRRNSRGQLMFRITIDDYPVLVPFVESNEHIFLKTAYRSRKEKAKRERTS